MPYAQPYENSLSWPRTQDEAVQAIVTAMREGDSWSSLQAIAGFATAEDFVAATQKTMVDHIAHQTGMRAGNEMLLIDIFDTVYLRREKNERRQLPIFNQDGSLAYEITEEIPYDYAHEAAEKIAARLWEFAREAFPQAPEMIHCFQCHVTIERTDWESHQEVHT